jgi:hypothetical protein
MRERPLMGTTINQYLSHVANMLRELGYSDVTALLRPPRVGMMIDAWLRQDALALPERLRVKIPLTALLLLECIRAVHARYADPAQVHLRLGLCAALALGFGAALRPAEYLYKSTPTAGLLVLKGGLAFFKFADSEAFFPCHAPTAYPTHRGPPTDFVALFDTQKNDPHGHGAPRAIHAPAAGAAFNLVQMIFDFVRVCPPRSAEAPFLSGVEPMLTPAMIACVTREVATANGLDPDRLLPHSLRVGSLAQLTEASEADKCLHGGWQSVGGMHAYARPALEVARRVSASLHDTSASSFEGLRMLYMSAAVTSPAPWQG